MRYFNGRPRDLRVNGVNVRWLPPDARPKTLPLLAYRIDVIFRDFFFPLWKFQSDERYRDERTPAAMGRTRSGTYGARVIILF